MRSLLAVWVVCALGGVAAADAKSEIRALLATNAKAIAESDGRAYNDTLVLSDPYHSVPEDGRDFVSSPVQYAMGEQPGAGIWLPPGSGEQRLPPGLVQDVTDLTVVRPDPKGRFAYFVGSIDASYDAIDPDKPRLHVPMRVDGIAKLMSDKSWKLAAVGYARTLPDKELFKLVDSKFEVKPGRANDELDRMVLGWFDAKAPKPIEDDRAKSSPVLARGTAPGEVASSGAAADKLVKQWEALHMVTNGLVDSHKFADRIGYVTIHVGISVKAGVVPMELDAILVYEDTAWRWVSLQFAPPPPAAK